MLASSPLFGQRRFILFHSTKGKHTHTQKEYIYIEETGISSTLSPPTLLFVCYEYIFFLFFFHLSDTLPVGSSCYMTVQTAPSRPKTYAGVADDDLPFFSSSSSFERKRVDSAAAAAAAERIFEQRQQQCICSSRRRRRRRRD